MKYTPELQLSQIKELIYLECKKKSIGLTNDPDVLDSLIENAAELIIYTESCKDPRHVLDKIDDWIDETQRNYPNYFLKGEEYG